MYRLRKHAPWGSLPVHSRVWDSSPPISVVLGGMSILCFIHYSSVHNNINIQMTYQSAFGEGWRERTLSELQLEGVCRTEWGKPGTISERWFSSIIYIAGGLLSWPRFISKRIAAHTQIPEGINTYRCKTQRLVCSGPYGSIHQINSRGAMCHIPVIGNNLLRIFF